MKLEIDQGPKAVSNSAPDGSEVAKEMLEGQWQRETLSVKYMTVTQLRRTLIHVSQSHKLGRSQSKRNKLRHGRLGGPVVPKYQV